MRSVSPDSSDSTPTVGEVYRRLSREGNPLAPAPSLPRRSRKHT